MTTLWVVWEPNSQVPQIFASETEAFTYRQNRLRYIKHQVYVKAVVMPDPCVNKGEIQ